MGRVSILLASRGRPHLLQSVIKQIGETTSVPVELLIATEDDGSSLEVAEHTETAPHVVKRISYLKEVTHPNLAWNRLLKLSSCDIVFLAGDDAIYHPQWLEYALDAHDKVLGSYGMVGLNDGAWKRGQLATTPMYDKKFCREVLGGVCFVPHYHQYWADFENYERAVASGHYYWCEEARVTHTQGKTMIDMPNDESFRHSQQWSQHDGALLNSRRANGFPNDFDPVI